MSLENKKNWWASVSKHEKRGYSQTGEEGVLDYIFENLGVEKGFCIEFGAKNGFTQSNTRGLINKGWDSLLMDCEADAEFVKDEFITAENINQLFDKYDVPDVPDLISIDIDGNDYWVLKAIGRRPKVVIIECNPSYEATEAKTIKYNPRHVWNQDNYYGASPLALKMLAEQRGMKMIYCNRLNCILIDEDLIDENFEYKLSYVSTRGWPPCKDESKIIVDVSRT
jgi:hypothetical protein